ncbi:decaprenyl-diphosphate synthase subunit 2 [Odontomachus brunneus]|uniref:decaprenyl-diphosphate synthase subunit 2 n=1 Tax=Odontomachus brunneus TaxID=486640 RepID=UPI0013F1CBFB|nr:decaprenyl-diphosphate synthase subunit 2 [Odontomachus brunneus]XP_032690772.1 decaprenyl-diphosphate synthase subunit 2 [Odontomachus brunneus]
MSANMVVLRLWRKNNPMTLWKIHDISRIQRTICVSTQQRFLLSEKKSATAAATIMTTNKKLNWNKAISEAEKIVGYPTSFLSLKWLLSDEIANIALHLRKLVGSNHPLLKTAKNIIFSGHNNVQAFGLVVLLISKAAGHLNVNHIEEDKSAGVLHSQRTLAGIIEMIRISSLIHRGLVNINVDGSLGASEMDNMLFGNKIALLSGDYFLGSSCVECATLKNQDVLFLIASIVAELAQAEFIARRDSQNNPIPSIPPKDRTGYALKEWELLNIYDAGSLLGNSCQGTLRLAGHNNEIQQEGRKFGQHLSLAWQAYLDLVLCTNKDKAILYNLCAAPIMFHVEHDPSILAELEKGLKSVENVDYLKVLEIVTAGPGIELTKELIKEHSQKAMEILNIFEENDARKALSNIIATIGDF